MNDNSDTTPEGPADYEKIPITHHRAFVAGLHAARDVLRELGHDASAQEVASFADDYAATWIPKTDGNVVALRHAAWPCPMPPIRYDFEDRLAKATERVARLERATAPKKVSPGDGPFDIRAALNSLRDDDGPEKA